MLSSDNENSRYEDEDKGGNDYGDNNRSVDHGGVGVGDVGDVGDDGFW